MMNNKRGQAALEFLTTYGWAFMVILLMIGALAYFGVLNPDRFLPQRCNVGPEFSCNEYLVSVTDGMKVKFSNNVGQTITVSGAVATWDKETAPGVVCTFPDAQISAADEFEILCDLNESLFPPTGNKIKVALDFTYLPAGRDYEQPLAVEIFATIQE